MSLSQLLEQLRRRFQPKRPPRHVRARRFIPRLESLEERIVPSEFSLDPNTHILYVTGNEAVNNNFTLDTVVHIGGLGVYARDNISGAFVSYAPGAVSSISVDTGYLGTNTVNVLRTVCPVNIGEDGLQDFANLGTGGRADGIFGPVNFSILNQSFFSHSPHLTIDDSADPNGRNVTIGATGVSGLLGSGSITTGGIPNFFVDMTIEGGIGNNTYTINGSPAFQSTTLNTGTGVDTVNVQATSYPLTINYQGGGGNDVANLGNNGSVRGITGAVTIAGGPNRTNVNINDSNDTGFRIVSISGSGVTGLAPAAIAFYTTYSVNTLSVRGGTGNNGYTYTDIGNQEQSTTLNTGTGFNTVDVLSTAAPLNINGGGGQDTVYVGAITTDSGSLANIHGAINVTNATGGTQLKVFDDNDTTGRAATLNDGSLTWSNYAAPITWTPTASTTGGVTSLDIGGGSGGNTFTINNTSTFSPSSGTILETGAGNNTVYVLGTTGSLDLFDGGQDTVTVGSTTGSGGSLANINGFVGVADFRGGVASLIIDDSGDTTGQTATLDNNTSDVFRGPTGQLSFSGYAAGIAWGDQRVSSVTINGGSGGNTFTVNSSRTTGPSIALNAGAGNDTVKMQGTAFSPLTVSDQGSNNTLDYSGYTGDVTVDIPLGFASLISGGISGFQNVIGSNGNDILVGDGSGNMLIGGTGRSLLIAGSAAGTLQGNAADNILIGGSTQYDSDLASLDAIFAEWTRTDLGYADRVNDILNGGGLNGAAILNASTVTGNGGGNTLLGGGELNLYFGSLDNDQTDYDPNSGEVFVSV